MVDNWFRKHTILMGIIIFLVIIFIISSFTTKDEQESSKDVEVIGEISEIKTTPEIQKTEQLEYFKVTRVIDGDTIEIETGERVRLICIDTPERGEEGYIAASNYLQILVLNKKVRLVKDVSETGKYGRLVRYIYIDDLFVNEKMVEEGYAKVYWYNPDISLCPQIEKAEKEAKKNKKGIWADVEEKTDTTEYDCSSNIYNCGDFLTHTDAQAVFEACGGISNDVHRLDQDNDGIACESLP